jgi:hypothetical protein
LEENIPLKLEDRCEEERKQASQRGKKIYDLKMQQQIISPSAHANNV